MTAKPLFAAACAAVLALVATAPARAEGLRHLVQNEDPFLNQRPQEPPPGGFHHRRFDRGDSYLHHRPPVEHYRQGPERGYYRPDRGRYIPDRDHGGRWGDQYGGVLPPVVIINRLEQRGFSDVRNLRMRGGNYIVEAVGPRGNPVKVVLNSQTGEFVGFRILERGGPAGGWNW
jgi:hypothetical protein